MSAKPLLKYDLLDREHLLYELQIRGVRNISSKVKNVILAKNLTYLLNCEQAGVEYEPVIQLRAVEEIQTCMDIYNEINQFSLGILYEDLIFKLDVTFWHVRNRLGRIATENDEQLDQITYILEKLDVSEAHYDKKRKFLLELSPQGELKSNTSLPSTSKGNVVVNPSLPPILLTDPDYVPVAKWGFCFDGKNRDSLDVLTFIRKVNQMSKVHQVPEHKLLNSINCLFRGRADVWYRSVQGNILTWDDLCCKLKKEFLPRNFEKVIKQRLKDRYQQKDETIGTFIAHLDDLASYLPTPLSAEKRLQQIKQNMLPEYQDKLALVEVNSEHHLLELIDKIDACKSSLSSRRQSYTKNSDTRVRFLNSVDSELSSGDEAFKCFSGSNRSDLAASTSRDRRDSFDNSANNSRLTRNRSPSSHLSNNSDNKPNTKNKTKTSQGKAVNSLKCYRCDSDQHLVRNCTSKLVKCYKCGKLGYTKHTCPNCCNLPSQGNGRRN